MCDSTIEALMRSRAPYGGDLASYDVGSFKLLVDNFSDLIKIGCKGKDINSSNVDEKKKLFVDNSKGCFNYGKYTHANVGAKSLTHNKYLKYKAKYMNLKNIFEYYNIIGGGRVPLSLPRTQSWLYMPIVLLPFTDVTIDFPKEFQTELTLLSHEMGFKYDTFDKIKEKLKEYYEDKKITNFSDRGEITKADVAYDDGGAKLHLKGEDQVKILENTEIAFIIESLAERLVQKRKGLEYTFRVK